MVAFSLELGVCFDPGFSMYSFVAGSVNGVDLELLDSSTVKNTGYIPLLSLFLSLIVAERCMFVCMYVC